MNLDIASAFLNNGFSVLNFALLLFTAVLSFNTYRFQKQAGLRESLEQLEDVEFLGGKLRPILHKFSYIPMVRATSMVELQYYQFGREPSSAGQLSKPLQIQYNSLTDRGSNEYSRQQFNSDLMKFIINRDKCKRVEVNDNGILLEFETVNPVVVRRRTRSILKLLNNNLSTDLETWKDNIENPQI